MFTRSHTKAKCLSALASMVPYFSHLILSLCKNAWPQKTSAPCCPFFFPRLVQMIPVRRVSHQNPVSLSNPWYKICIRICLLPLFIVGKKTVCEPSSMSEFIVFLKQYPDDVLVTVRSWSAHLIDTLLSHEAMGEDDSEATQLTS